MGITWCRNLWKMVSTACSEKNVFFPKNFQYFAISTSSALAIGCTKNGYPIGVTVHSHHFESLLQRYVDM